MTLTRKDENGNSVVKVPTSLIPWLVGALLTVGVSYASVMTSYSESDGKVLEQRMDATDKRFDKLDQKIDRVEEKLDRLLLRQAK